MQGEHAEALAVLDHIQLFFKGEAAEARLRRIERLIALGRKEEALSECKSFLSYFKSGGGRASRVQQIAEELLDTKPAEGSAQKEQKP